VGIDRVVLSSVWPIAQAALYLFTAPVLGGCMLSTMFTIPV
jgi:hypothetical protein